LLSQLKKVKAPSGLADLIKKGPPKSSGINWLYVKAEN
jgi:hypothetical protein